MRGKGREDAPLASRERRPSCGAPTLSSGGGRPARVRGECTPARPAYPAPTRACTHLVSPPSHHRPQAPPERHLAVCTTHGRGQVLARRGTPFP
ncbi:hypothetical protein EVAR_94194_1 [Eumeta japonica]|uniref:Uncharacterized protein n=1 Tax=Eumeta variegata TaxID=151549 RepID=A0A4C1UMX8_EUMVA|nr:hypothetical protein EVAR_94194_1 [Eumeta japonica]